MNNGLKKVNQENLTTKVYEQIKNALMRGQFYPGDRLAIRPLAEQLGTSPTPVREALLKLISFGALEMKPAHPIVVPTMTRDKYLENRTLRISIEGLAAETAAANIKKKDIDHLKKLHNDMVKALRAGDHQLILAKNHSFHMRLCRAAAMPTLVFIAEILWLQIGPFLNMLQPKKDHQRHIISKNHEHIKIIRALESGNGSAARKALESDLIQGGAPLLDYFSDTQES
ncbi:MAG: GntR family transcriptional regulator [Thermodesulfobacteriota bacterium]